MERPLWNRTSPARDRRVTSLRIAGLLFLLILFGRTTPMWAASFTATIDRDTITLGENVTLSLTFEDGSPKDVPTPPAITNLQINYAGPSSQFSVINGQVSSTVTHVFTVTPRQVGDYAIPSLTAEVGSQKLTTQPIKLKVLSPSAPSPEAVNSGSQPAFLKLALPRK